jgi:hypothetical protein
MILIPSMTMQPAMTALVVAMAGMMLPAIDLMSKRLFCEMPKIWTKRNRKLLTIP